MLKFDESNVPTTGKGYCAFCGKLVDDKCSCKAKYYAVKFTDQHFKAVDRLHRFLKLCSENFVKFVFHNTYYVDMKKKLHTGEFSSILIVNSDAPMNDIMKMTFAKSISKCYSCYVIDANEFASYQDSNVFKFLLEHSKVINILENKKLYVITENDEHKVESPIISYFTSDRLPNNSYYKFAVIGLDINNRTKRDRRKSDKPITKGTDQCSDIRNIQNRKQKSSKYSLQCKPSDIILDLG